MLTKLWDMEFSPISDALTELYYRSCGFFFNDGCLMAEMTDSKVSFDTYFNSVPINKLKNYTSAGSIVFQIDGENINTEFYAQCEHEDVFLGVSSRIYLDDIPADAVNVYPVITSTAADSKINNISVFADAEEREVSVAVIICTYKREAYLLSNIRKISEQISDYKLKLQIIVVDNACSLDSADMPKNVILISNINSGGSGGFGKGMKAASEMSVFTHFILMDDDVKIDCISLRKLIGFLKIADHDHTDICVSGAMLYMNDPVRQFESGGYFSPEGIQSGTGHYLDMTKKTDLYTNELEKKINYGGWWFMCIPMRYADEGNYPMPFFIKYDDVEYSLRCKLEIITVNGVGVWHEPFEWKYNSSSEYYNIRNYLFLRSIMDKRFTKHSARKIAQKQYLEKLCRQQYKMAKAVKWGYLDYLKGLDTLEKLDAAENHKRVCSLNYEMLSIDEVFEKYGIRFTEEKLESSYLIGYKWYMKPFLYGLLLPSLFCKKEYGVVDAFFDRKEMYWRRKMIIHYCSSNNKAYVTSKLYRDRFTI